MDSKFINIQGVNLFYRTTGNGSPIVLLHASPRSGKMLEGFGKLLANNFKVIIPDLPGYGFSESIPERVNTLYDVVPLLRHFFGQIGVEKPSIYGTATGAQLGIAYSLSYPTEVQMLYLDNPAHFSEKEYLNIAEHYFLDLTPTPNGEHLTKLWNHVRDSMMYFPWYEKTPKNQFNTIEPSATIISEIVREYLIAGVRYDELYRAAFLHERAEKVQALTIPTTIFKWEGSILLKYIDKLLSFDLPENIHTVETPKDMTERYQKMAVTIIQSSSNILNQV